MCGIAVVHDLHPTPERLREAAALGAGMLERIRHRGPDGVGEHRLGATWLGHVRLAIVDLTGGAQPLLDSSGQWAAVANGEIYNHLELRDELGEPARPWQTASDSESILQLVRCWGQPSVHRLRGMYAFAVAGPDGTLLLGRDPLGVKPLYWAHADSRVLAASELSAFPTQLRDLVREFPPGHVWSPSDGLRPFVDVLDNPLGLDAGPLTPFTRREDAVTAIRETLVRSVQERMMADVEIGVFLSGGLDSSIVAAAMARLTVPGQVIHSFAAGTADSPDLPAARRVAAELGLDHHERIYTDEDVAAVLEDVVRRTESYEPSLIRSAVPNYLLAELAARHVKVVLTGEGADELFAGYHHLRELDPQALHQALRDGIAGLHNLNLQRCDRVTMAHGLEGRVPFLAREMLAVAFRVPVQWKDLGADGQAHAQEKALLREAFRGWLPPEILWRRKEQFGDGSGTSAVTATWAAAEVTDPGWQDERYPHLPAARTREELAYQRIFVEHLGGVRADEVLGRFALP